MAAILDFQVPGRVDFISIPMGITVPNLVFVSQFAQFCHKIDVICPTTDRKSHMPFRSVSNSIRSLFRQYRQPNIKHTITLNDLEPT